MHPYNKEEAYLWAEWGMAAEWEVEFHQSLVGRVKVGCKWQSKIHRQLAVLGCSLGCILVVYCPVVHPVQLSGWYRPQ